MTTTSIEWTDAVWNPTTGCDRVSPGCDHCYAMTMAKRLKGMGSAKYQRDGDSRTSGPGFGITEHASTLDAPLSWRKPRKVFVNSMSDLFHDGVSDGFIADVFATMALAHWHTYQVLTKRHGRMRSLLSSEQFRRGVESRVEVGNTEAFRRHIANWPLPNVWLGVSTEDQKRADLRIPALLQTPAAVRWISAEPLIGPILLCRCDGAAYGVKPHPFLIAAACPLHGSIRLDWVVTGGESGPEHRPFNPDWARSLRDQCTATGVPFLFKQHGGATPKANGRELDGRTHDEYPAVVA